MAPAGEWQIPIRGARWDAAAGRPGERGRPRPGEARRVQRRPAPAGRGMQGQPKKEKREVRGGELKRVALGLLRPKQKAALDLFAPQRPPGKATPAADEAVPRVVWVAKKSR